MTREMKNSGIPWIGEIPEGWKMCFIKQIMRNKSIKGFPNERVLSLYRDYGVVPKDSRDDNHNVTSDDTSSYKLVDDGDFVINKMKAWQGSMAVSEYRGIISPAYYICRITTTDINKRYIHYLLRNDSYKTEYMRLSSGLRVGQWDLNIDDFLRIMMILPPLAEQQRIAEFLDRKCGEVDEMIALQEQIIEELKAYKQSVITEAVTKGLNPAAPMRDSGIDWIGSIPEHWEVCRVKNVASLFGRIGFRGYTSDDLNKDGEGAITLSPSNMLPMGMDYTNVTYLSWMKYHESPEIMIQNGDILMVKTGSSYGKVSYVDNLPKEATINPQILRIVSRINSKYLGYYLQTPLFIYQVEGGVVGGTIPTISQEKINNFFVAMSSIEEQQAIADYLDEKCADIDSLIQTKQSKIDSLKEYKKSIIYEYVTGKREVNE